jgi:acetyl esterase/lipase
MKFLSTLLLLGTAAIVYGQQKVVSLYSGKAPGSENWSWKEQSIEASDWGGTRIVYNVVEPTLTIYPAQGSGSNGTAVIIAPGGGLFALSINSEGNEVAEWLSKRGVTAFVLKYRLVHTTDPTKEFRAAITSPEKLDSLIGPIAPLAMQDGLTAVAHVRKNAAAYRVNAERIGFMGFSAGGGVTMSVAYNASEGNRPNFIAPIYAWDKDILGSTVPKEKMPAFVVVAADDGLNLAPVSVDIYNKWRAAQQPAELHIYQSGGHGFGMKKQGKASDTWIDRFGEWLRENKWL